MHGVYILDQTTDSVWWKQGFGEVLFSREWSRQAEGSTQAVNINEYKLTDDTPIQFNITFPPPQEGSFETAK